MTKGDKMDKELTIFVISDSIGETGELLSLAALSQFNSGNYSVKRFPYIISEDQIVDIFNEARKTPSVVFYTIVIEKLRSYVDVMGEEYGIPTVDLMSPALDAIEKVLKFSPKRESGLIRKLDENYFRKVDAVEFAVKYDDGKDARGIRQSDIVLIGISRTSKTPLSMYLAHKNFKVANIPLVPEVSPPKELFEKDKKRIIGLIARPDNLNEIRQERLKSLGLSNNAVYANLGRINQELNYSKNIMDEIGCLVIDVSNKAIEETAGLIIEYMNTNFGDKVFK